jgi:hypothetical protein
VERAHKKRTIALQEAIARSGGTKHAADIIEQAVFTRKLVFAQKQPQSFNKFYVGTWNES